MRCLLITIGLLLAPLGVFALTWDFAEDTTWGWTAQESLLGADRGLSPTTVYSEVADGVWRIAPVPDGKQPAIRLRSPPIGEDSALFDYVTLRLRIIHDRPTGGNLHLEWFNPEYRRLREELGPTSLDYYGKFYTIRYQIYPTEWENITIDMRALKAAAEANPEAEIVWQDTLFNFNIELDLNITPQGPADHPAFVEIDWIQLTGAEELLLGELQPREIAVEAELLGRLFAKPDFFPFEESLVMSGLIFSSNALGDVDGDGDIDLVALWKRETVGIEMGWMMASNDGLGGFVSTRASTLLKATGSYQPPRIAGGDFDGDGLLDLAVQRGLTLELWHNRGEDGFEPILQWSDVLLRSLADGDGDGDIDLLVNEVYNERPHIVLRINDGAAGFAHSDRFVLDTQEALFPLVLAGQSLGEAIRLLWIRPCYLPQGTLQLTQPWAASKPPPLFFEAPGNPCDLHLITDLDGDGGIELVGSSERNLQHDPRYVGTTYHGLVLWRVDALGGIERHTLLGSEVRLPHRAIASDLNGDGLLDLAVVDGNLATGPALVVLTGQRDGVPVVEGRYRLPGVGGPVLAGDMNGDGATDLVVLGRSVEGGPGGAFVFLNQGVAAATAVADETTATPITFALGANYPNPFNPATTIPVSVPGVDDVDVTIYNILGQPVRQVWNGPLVAGEHRLTWDGRDTGGQAVAAGVYLYRLQAGDQMRLRKMVKLE